MTAFYADKRLTAFADLDENERKAVRRLAGPSISVAAGRPFTAQGSTEPLLYVLHAGWVASTLQLANGSCQILKLHLPSDIMSATSLPYRETVDHLIALTAVEYSEISLSALGDLLAEHPRIGALLYLAAQQEKVFLMERLASIGRTEAPARVAALLLHLQERLSVQLGMNSRRLDVPLSQQQLGDVLGLSEVHVNRVLQQMEREGLIRRDRRQFEILHEDALRALTGMPARNLRSDQTWLPASRAGVAVNDADLTPVDG